MAKSNRRKKQDRAKAAAKQARARRRRTMTTWLRAAEQRLERIHDPATPAAELATLLAEQYTGSPVAGWLASALLEEGSSVARLQDAARAMVEADQADEGEPSLTALTFAATVARVAGDATEERRLIDQALGAAGRADDPDVRVEVVDFISVSGHPAWAVELLEPRLRVAPDDGFAARLYGAAIEHAHEKAGEPERAVLRKFADRSGLIALRAAVRTFLAGTELGAAVQARVTEDLSAADDLDWTPQERTAFGELAEELALLTADPDDNEDDMPDDAGDLLAEDDPSGTPLRAFAADPSTPPALAARALAWHEHIQHGLWRIDDPVPSPGLWCTDIVTGTEWYVEFPAEVTAVLPRWSVWLGGIVPVDGIWRSTGLGVRLSPAEGDAAAEFVGQASVAMLYAIQGKRERPPTSIPFGTAEPHGVYADDEEPSSSEAAELMGR